MAYLKVTDACQNINFVCRTSALYACVVYRCQSVWLIGTWGGHRR